MVIDASVAFKWIVEEEGSAAALSWIGRQHLIAPTLVHIEVGNALWARIRRGQLKADDTSEQLAGLAQLVTTVDETPFVPRALEMAGELGHPIYDCVYLAIAEQHDDQLLTADLKLLARLNKSTHSRMVVAL